MKNEASYEKILSHEDKDEIIAKLSNGVSAKDITEWLEAKYSGVPKYIISEKSLNEFKKDHLNFYKFIQADKQKAKEAIELQEFNDLQLSVEDNKYKDLIINAAKTELGNQISIEQSLVRMNLAAETMCGRLYDNIMESGSMKVNDQRVLIDWMRLIGEQLEKFDKLVNKAPDQVIQHNITVQHIDSQVSLIQDAIREALSFIDLDAAMLFMTIFNEKLNKLKLPKEEKLSLDQRTAEVKMISQEIEGKLNEK